MGNRPSSNAPGSRSSFRRQSVRRNSHSLVQKDGVRHHAEASENPKWDEAADTSVEVGSRFAHSLLLEGDSGTASYSANACRDMLDGGWGVPSFTEGDGDGDEPVSQVVGDETPANPDEAEGREASGSIVEFEVEADPEEDKQEEEWLQNVVDSTHGYGLHADALEESLPHARASQDYDGEAVFQFNPVFNFDCNEMQDAEWVDKIGTDEGPCWVADEDSCSYRYSPDNWRW